MSHWSDRFAFDASAGQLIVRVGKVEIGQHVHHAMIRLAAEALRIRSSRLYVAPVSTQDSPNDGLTAGSVSVQVTGAQVTELASALRQDLLQDAALRLNANPQDVHLDPETLVMSAGDKTCALFDLPLAVDHPGTVSRDARAFAPSISASITGTRLYIQDMTLPNLLYARALRGRAVPQKPLERAEILHDKGFSAVVAESPSALEAAWARVPDGLPVRDTGCDGPIADWITGRAASTRDIEHPDPISGGISVTASRPFLLHASIAPACAIALFEKGQLTIWTHSQGMHPLRDTLASHLSMSPDDVRLNHVPSAGSYGHNAADDVVMDAVLVCLQRPGRPVKVSWPRQDEFRHSPVGAPMLVRVDATLTDKGAIGDWRHTLWSGPHGQRPGAGGNVNLLAATEREPHLKTSSVEDLPDAVGSGAARNIQPPYAVGTFGATRHLVQDLPVRTSSIRGLGAQVNVLAIEMAMDRLADQAGVTPLDFRLAHITDPRGANTLRRLGDLVSTAAPNLSEDEAIGIGYSRYKDKAAYAAVAAQVRFADHVELVNVWTVVDAGRIADPSGALNQIEGGIVQAASWTLHEGAWLRDGYVDAADWSAYPIISWSDIPDIDAHLVRSDAPALGVGECMVGPVTAAIANAITRIAGQDMPVHLPLTRDNLLRALASD